ncbi:MAG: serine hydrolase [Bacteroidota bacterium]
MKAITIVIILSITLNTYSQITKSQYQEIDSLFLEWARPNQPGGVVAIMKGEDLVFSKAYGLASLEYNVPNTTETIFNLASVSKQFTAMGIVVLEQEGKLSFDDDIRKFIPELPNFGHTITIRNMLQNTSGLRSFHDLLALAGWRSGERRNNTDLYRLMLKQRDLNFRPGQEYSYSNTNYMLMVNVIEKITGEKFADWMKKSVFRPLGMTNTYVEDDYRRVVPNRATSYFAYSDGVFRRVPEYWGYYGSANVHSTTKDLLKWLSNFYRPQSGWKTAFQKLLTRDRLNDGRENKYAFGVMVEDINGFTRIAHDGSTGGFKTFIGVYPEEELNIVILANRSSRPWDTALEIADIVLEERKSTHTIPDLSSMETVELPGEKMKKFEGSYWDDSNGRVRVISVKNDTLRELQNPNAHFYPIGHNTFVILEGTKASTCEFIIAADGTKKMIRTYDDGKMVTSESFDPNTLLPVDLSAYTGTYYSPELETIYSIRLEDEQLVAHHARHGALEMRLIKNDIFLTQWPLRKVEISRDKNGMVTGFFTSNGRVWNLWFEKQK